MKKKNISTEKTLATAARWNEQDLRGDYELDRIAAATLKCLKGWVSPSLLALFEEMLLGFDNHMQTEIADDLLDFAREHVVQTTGCLTADSVLKAGYMWIASEQGYDEADIKKSLRIKN